LKIHRPQSEIIIKCLRDIFDNKYLADKVVQIQLKTQKQMGARDRRFVAESVYEIVRWWRLLKEISGDKTNPWKWYGVYLIRAGFELPNWREFESLRGFSWPEESEVSALPRAVRESIPDWLDELGEKEFACKWDLILSALNKPADVILRANQLKMTVNELIPTLLSEGIEVKSIDGDALLMTTRKNLFTSEAYQAGLFEIQDWSSQQIAPFLGVTPGDRVIDACAGAGGKTLHMAAMMKNKGRIIAMDIHEKKLEELRRRKNRAGVDIVETRPIESGKTIKKLAESADKVLLDVPCSGLGVLRRKPDSKWKLSVKKILELNGLQREILAEYSSMVKKGGTLVYSTCSILPSENQEVVEDFVKKNAQFRLLEEKTLLPNETGFDGFYMAKMSRC
jgi:16S rRNA (cytosine967-C5)-methyltransferase